MTLVIRAMFYQCKNTYPIARPSDAAIALAALMTCMSSNTLGTGLLILPPSLPSSCILPRVQFAGRDFQTQGSG